jgi:folate-dependent phosphoribosylglycinamide formyltransferase PurN
MRIALFTLEALAAATAVRRFVARHADDIVLVGLSDPFRPAMGGSMGQTWRHLRRSGPRFLPYLTANFALPRLAGLIARALPASRDVTRVPLEQTCQRLGIPCMQVQDVNDAATHARLTASGAELIVSFHFDQIFTAASLDQVPLGGINVHAALLPLHRGPVPTIHALRDPKQRFGVTIHRLVPRIDAGALLAQTALDLPAGTTALAAAALLHEAALPLLDIVLAEIDAGCAVDHALPTLPYCGFPTPREMAEMAAAGHSAADWRDIKRALATPA